MTEPLSLAERIALANQVDQDPVVELLREVRTEMAATRALVTKKNGNGNGNGIIKTVTDNLIYLLILGFMALSGWVFTTNADNARWETRINGIEKATDTNARNIERLESRVYGTENQRGGGP